MAWRELRFFVGRSRSARGCEVLRSTRGRGVHLRTGSYSAGVHLRTGPYSARGRLCSESCTWHGGGPAQRKGLCSAALGCTCIVEGIDPDKICYYLLMTTTIYS